MAEQRVYQGHTYTRAAPGQPWSLAGPAQGGMTQLGGLDPMKPLQRRATEVGIARTTQDMDAQAQLTPLQVVKARADAEAARLGVELKKSELKKTQAGTTLTPDKLKAVRVDALNKIILARQLKDKSRNGWFATGFMAPTMSGFGGTAARDVQAKADTLKAGGALAEVLKLTAANGGKNPFQPMSNSDVDLISRNVANLDIGQSDEEFQRATDQYEGAYSRAFLGANGSQKALRDALVKLGLEKRTAKPRQNGPTRINDDAGYDRLPSGSMFIGPDGVTRRKP